MDSIQNIDVNCRGQQCPAPILSIARAARGLKKNPGVLHVYADDGDFPADVEAWCRTAKATLEWGNKEADGAFHAIIALNGATLPATPSALPPPPPGAKPPAAPAASAVEAAPIVAQDALDLRGLSGPAAIMKLTAALMQRGGATVVVADAATFESAVFAWSSATQARITDIHKDAGQMTCRVAVEVELPPAPVAAPVAMVPAAAPETTGLAVASDAVPRENRATLLVLHNDLEALLAAMLCANAAAAQGMDVNVFFSFWGVNLLRGDRPRPDEPRVRVGLMTRMMKWMMPRGPRKQRLGKMHMGGMGTGMMRRFMAKNNILPLEDLLNEAQELGVTFTVCTMSMGVMGIQKRDLKVYPHMKYAGVTSFMEGARSSAISLVF